MTYQQAYKQGISFYNKDYRVVLPFLESGEHVALCSSLATGEERFINYCSYRLSSEEDYSVIEINSSYQDIQQVINNVQMSKKKCVVLIPYFYKDVSYSTELLSALYQTYKNGEFTAIIKLPWDFHCKPEKYSEIAPFVTNLIIRQPLSISELAENISLREQLHDWQSPPSEKYEHVMELSGGLIRLVKRILKYYDQHQSLAAEDMLDYPGIITILAQLTEMYSELPNNKLKELGILDSGNRIRSSLFGKYLEDNDIAPKKELTSMQKDLFNLLYQNRGDLVTDEMIDKVVRKGEPASLWANYKLVSRLKDALGGEYDIQTKRGKGYILKVE